MQPNIEQLREIIRKADDNVDKVLILKTDGAFELIIGAGNSAVGHINYVTRWETFDAKNDYFGPEASQDNNWLDTIMTWANDAWEKHRKTGQTHILNPNS